MHVLLERGDITESPVDAVVNAANSSLLGGGGVDGAIHRAGGPAILRACRELRASEYPDGLPVGRAVATTAGELPATWVIHTVGPTYSLSEDRSGVLASAFTESLRIAEQLPATSIAFPAISTGVYRYPVDEAARIALRAVRDDLRPPTEVRFVLFDESTLRAFEAARRDVFG